MTDNKFAKGIILKKIGKYNDIKMLIKADLLLDDSNNFNDDGWGNFIIRISKEGKPYCIVDEWKPAKEETKEVVKFDEVDISQLPF